MQADKKIGFQDGEVVTREQLVDEIRRATNIDAPAKQKILTIDYLIRHYYDDDKPKSKWHPTQF